MLAAFVPASYPFQVVVSAVKAFQVVVRHVALVNKQVVYQSVKGSLDLAIVLAPASQCFHLLEGNF